MRTIKFRAWDGEFKKWSDLPLKEYPIADIKFIIENRYTPILSVFLFSFFIKIQTQAQHKQLRILYTVTKPLAVTNDGASVAVKSLTA